MKLRFRVEIEVDENHAIIRQLKPDHIVKMIAKDLTSMLEWQGFIKDGTVTPEKNDE